MTEVAHEGLILRLATDKLAYQPGEVVTVAARVENTSLAPVTYTLWGIGDPALSIALGSNPYYDGHVPLNERDFQNKIIYPMITSEVLAGGQRLTREVIWNQIVPTYPNSIQAPPGRYAIEAVFYVGAYSSANPPFALTAKTEIEIGGTTSMITPEAALARALELPEVTQWLEKHSGSSIVKREGESFYVFFDAMWQRVVSTFEMNGLTIDQLRTYVPAPVVNMVANSWRVRWFTKLGPEPNDISVTVDPLTGVASVVASSPVK